MNTESVVIASYQKSGSPIQLEDEIWNACKPVHIKHYWSGDSAPVSRHAEVRICWDDSALHTRFVCTQVEPLVIAKEPQTATKTIGLWDRDVCEIFLAVDPHNSQGYFEFEAAPTGEWIDLGIQITEAGKETDWNYSSGMTTAAQIKTAQVVLGITIPWSSHIPKPREGDEWRANLFRCVGNDEATRYLAWRPTRTTQPNFHVPEAFGVLLFK